MSLISTQACVYLNFLSSLLRTGKQCMIGLTQAGKRVFPAPVSMPRGHPEGQKHRVRGRDDRKHDCEE